MGTLETAIDHAGSQQKLAEQVGVTQQAISKWLRDGISADFVIPVARAVDFAVTPHDLDPELYPHPEDGLPLELREQARAGE